MDITELLKKYVNNEELDYTFSNKEMSLLIEQSLQTIVYPLTHNKEYKKYYVSWVLKQETFFKVQEEITQIFNDNNINHVYFKGSVLAKIYDDSTVRTRGDIDLYINPYDLDKAKKLLLDNGYICDLGDNTHHIGFRNNEIEVELHFNMLDLDCDKKWIKLFSNPFELSEVKEKSLYEYKPTYHFIYCLMHFANHLRYGAGLRYLLDFYYMFEKTTIDFELLHKHINECHLTRLYSNIINALRMIFDKDYDNTIDDEDVTFFLDYLKLYGIHGNSHNDSSPNASRYRNKFRFAISRIFLTEKNYRLMRFPRMGKHWILYPIMILIHWIYLVTHKMNSFLKFLFGKNKNKKLYKKLGV